MFYRPNAYAVEDSVGYLMKQIMVSFVAQADKRLAAHGLTHAQWGPLMRLRVMGESTVADMARWLHVDASATTRLIDRLEKKFCCELIVSVQKPVTRIRARGQSAAEMPVSAPVNRSAVNFSFACVSVSPTRNERYNSFKVGARKAR